MARIKYPVRFIDWTIFFKKIFAKWTSEPATSPINPFLAEETILLGDDNTDVTSAIGQHDVAEQLGRDAETDRKKRDLLFDPVWKDHTEMVQALKALKRKNPHELGDWSVSIDGENEVVYPVDFMQRTEAVIAFLNKHNSYAVPTSPIQPFITENNIDVAAHLADIPVAVTNHDAFIQKNNDKETAYGNRNNLIDPIKSHIRGIGGWLVALYVKNPKKAGDYAFTIDDSPQAPVTRTIELAANETRTLKNLDVDSIMANLSGEVLQISPGENVSSTPYVLNPNAEFKIVRGFGTMTIHSTSTTNKAKIQADFHH